MKSHKNIACIDFANVNVALNLHAYKHDIFYELYELFDLQHICTKVDHRFKLFFLVS